MARTTSALVSEAVLNGVKLFHLALSAECEVIWSRAARPDPGWSSTDARGHFHAYDSDGKLPTLVASNRQIPCDGSCRNWDCDGYSERVHQCALCGEQVQPGTVEREHAEPLETAYTATVSGPRELLDALAPDELLSLSWPGGFATARPDGNVTVFNNDVVEAGLRLVGPPRTRLGSLSMPFAPRPADIGAAITAGAAALDGKAVDFSRIVADAVIRAALPHLGLDAEGKPLP
jgi:hypothetical protein